MIPSNKWQDLAKHHESLVNVRIQDLFQQNPQRFADFSLQVHDILLDYSKQHVTRETLELLFNLAKSSQLKEYIQALFAGEKVNTSEQRSALHMALRDPTHAPIMVNEQNIKPDIHLVLSRMGVWTERVRSGSYLGGTGKRITDVVSLGIGGSDLGPSMVYQALSAYKTTDIALHFISNVDGKTLAEVLKHLDPETCLCIINSKTFTTPETLQNATRIKKWLTEKLGEKNIPQHLVGVTANPDKALLFGILRENIFEFWDFVGGRYSIWSSVGLPIALSLGMEHFRSFLAGAHLMDQHFYTAPFSENMPVILALLGIWNINFENSTAHAVLPYEDGLEQFPNYLQQLEMESNGKTAARDTGTVSHATAPIIWGGVGCNGQHAYMQLLHQGTQVIPVDFLLPAQGHSEFDEHHKLLVASCLSQSKALMEGNIDNGTPFNQHSDAKHCSGDRPSNTLMYSTLTPKVLGSLIALYEHKVFVQGIIWGINSFDQWGVELGKTLVREILPHLDTALVNAKLDSSTRGLIEYYQYCREQSVKKTPETL